MPTPTPASRHTVFSRRRTYRPRIEPTSLRTPALTMSQAAAIADRALLVD
jgi:hypothetical protein